MAIVFAEDVDGTPAANEVTGTSPPFNAIPCFVRITFQSLTKNISRSLAAWNELCPAYNNFIGQ